MGRSRRRRGSSRGSSSSSRKSSSDAELVYKPTPNAKKHKSFAESPIFNEYFTCPMLYRSYMQCERGWGEGHRFCDSRKDLLEDACGQYKSLWSSWWTQEDEKWSCHMWKVRSDGCTVEKCGSDSLYKECAERACKFVLTPPPPPPKPYLGLFNDQVTMYCI